MIKIELVKFEAQDVITVSGTPVAPAEATKLCDICKEYIKESEWKNECQGGWKHMFTE